MGQEGVGVAVIAGGRRYRPFTASVNPCSLNDSWGLRLTSAIPTRIPFNRAA